jgi:hypothetical protein
MAHNQQSQVEAESHENKSIFIFRMIRIRDNLGSLISKNRLCLQKVDTVLLEIRSGFVWILLEMKFIHGCILTTM